MLAKSAKLWLCPFKQCCFCLSYMLFIFLLIFVSRTKKNFCNVLIFLAFLISPVCINTFSSISTMWFIKGFAVVLDEFVDFDGLWKNKFNKWLNGQRGAISLCRGFYLYLSALHHLYISFVITVQKVEKSFSSSKRVFQCFCYALSCLQHLNKGTERIFLKFQSHLKACSQLKIDRRDFPKAK